MRNCGHFTGFPSGEAHISILIHSNTIQHLESFVKGVNQIFPARYPRNMEGNIFWIWAGAAVTLDEPQKAVLS